MSGAPETGVVLHGHGLTAVTAVKFNGVPAAFTISSGAEITATVPNGATSGPISITTPSGTLMSSTIFAVLTPATFSLHVVPATAFVLQGQSTAYAVKLDSTDGFSQLAGLQITGLPPGVTAKLTPPQITAGQTAILQIDAPPNQPIGTLHFNVAAAATVLGVPAMQAATVALSVQPVTTSFLGRTVEDDTMETPLAGVTITFLGMGVNGQPTDCAGYQTVSDAAGNFAFTNLPDNCAGVQLVRYDGTTATSPPGKHASVDLVYTIVAHQVVVSPVLVHLPLIQGQETVMVRQNFPTDQTFTFKTIPFLSVTVYANTTLTLKDGVSQPDPFPLTAVQVQVDRLPEAFSPAVQTGPTLLGFIVAFQPPNATASQPVAVTFPNSFNTPPGTSVTLFTLDPTRGQMVPYGSGVVSNDGTQILPNADPAHAGHNYGLVHFDWHGPTAPPPNQTNPPPNYDQTQCKTCRPIDLASGLEVITSTDIAINGARGSIGIVRTYRTLSTNVGPFGVGTNHNYGYQLDVTKVAQGLINLVMPDGNQLPFNVQPDGSFINPTVPALRGAVLSSPSSGTYNLCWKDGTVFQLQTLGRVTVLTSITDPNGNVITLVRQGLPITQVLDPVGRALTLTYDSSGRITSITDPIGRTVSYTYNSQGTLATVTDPEGGITKYGYDAQNHLTQITDPAAVAAGATTPTVTNHYDQNGRVDRQTLTPDNGTTSYTTTFAYTLLNPWTPAMSPVSQATVTDPNGNVTTHHFNAQGFLIDATDALGRTQVLEREAGTNQLLGIQGVATCYGCVATSGDQTFTRDLSGNLLTQTDALGATTTYTYDPTFNKVTSVTDPLGHVSTFAYDSHGNLLTVTDPSGATTTFAYDPTGLLLSVTDALGNVGTFGYDGLGNLTSVTDPLGNISALAYDGVSRVTTATDPRGRSTQMTYDNLDRIKELVDAANGVTQFNHDLNGNLLSLTDALGHTTSYAYDQLNRLTQRTDPLGAAETFQYDGNSNLTQRVDRKGQQSTYSYDALNRLITGAYGDAGTSLTYDARGRLLQASDSAGGVIQRSYDVVSRLLQEASPSGAVDYAYDLAGRRVSMTASGQAPVQYGYDAQLPRDQHPPGQPGGQLRLRPARAPNVADTAEQRQHGVRLRHRVATHAADLPQRQRRPRQSHLRLRRRRQPHPSRRLICAHAPARPGRSHIHIV